MDSGTHGARIDWDAAVKLAVVFSAVAALFAAAFSALVSAPVLIGMVLTAGAMISWRQSGHRGLPTG